jgi:hypothetical protein
MGSIARNVVVTFSVILAVTADVYSQEWTFLGNEFLIRRDFSEIVISEHDAGAARLFVDPIRNLPNGEAQRLRQLVVASLSDKVRMADSKDDANYWLQILFQHHKFPFKNPNNEPALGSVLFSICKYPIKEVTRDCENLTYYYFFDSARIDLFEKALALWTRAVFARAVK